MLFHSAKIMNVQYNMIMTILYQMYMIIKTKLKQKRDLSIKY